MKLLLSILLLFLIMISTVLHVYFIWKKQNWKTLWIQLGIIALAGIVGIATIYNEDIPTMAHLLNKLSPFET